MVATIQATGWRIAPTGSEYAEATTYIDAPAVGDLITASGLSDVEFAREIMAELGVLSEDAREQWTALFRSGRIPNGSV